MKLFGEYLVEKNLLKPEQLLQALILQLNKTPPLAEVAKKEGLLKDEEILEILKKQTTDQKDFKSAGQELGYWSNDLEEKIHSFTRDSRPTIGQIIYAEGFISLPDLTKALDEFVSLCSKVETAPKETTTPPAAAPPPQAEASPQKEPPANPVGSDYCHFFSQAMYQSILSTMESGNFNHLSQLNQELSSLKGNSRFCGAKLSELLVSQCILAVEVLTLSQEQFTEWFPKLLPEMKKTMTYLWSLRETIEAHQVELYGDSKDSQKDEILSHHSSLKEMISGLQQKTGAAA